MSDISTSSPESLPPTHSESVKETMAQGLALKAHKTEDNEDYVRERDVQSKFLDGEEISPTEMREA
jgi:hypothetical protein